MPLLTVTNLLTSQIQLQDPTGTTTFSQTLAPGQTKEFTITVALSEILEPNLVQSAGLGRVTFSIVQNPARLTETAASSAPKYILAERPVASSVPAGTHVFIIDLGDNGKLQMSNGTDWLDTEGRLT